MQQLGLVFISFILNNKYQVLIFLSLIITDGYYKMGKNKQIKTKY